MDDSRSWRYGADRYGMALLDLLKKASRNISFRATGWKRNTQTFTGVIPLIRYPPYPLCHSILGAANQPKGRFDKDIIVMPQQHLVSQTAVDVGRVKNTSTADVDRHLSLFGSGLLPRMGKMTGSGTLLGARKNPSRWLIKTLLMGLWMARYPRSIAVSPLPKISTVYPTPNWLLFLNSDE